MNSNSLERQRSILELLEGREFVKNAEIRERLDVTAMTVWRDLVQLEEKGLIRRSRGRVSRSSALLHEPDFSSKKDHSLEAKQRIAAHCVKHFIRSGDTLCMDGGTTVAAIARQPLPEKLTVLTNSLHTAALLQHHPARPIVYACGGLLREQSGTFIGREALAFFSRRRAVRYFLSATGVDALEGVTDFTLEDNEVKQAMAQASEQIILLADQSKLGVVSLMKVLPWRRIHHFVTDAPQASLEPIAIHCESVQRHSV